MNPCIEGDKKPQTVDAFGCCPGATSKAFDVISKHGTGVIKAKKWVMGTVFKFTLSDHAPSSPLKVLMLEFVAKNGCNKSRVSRAFIGLQQRHIRC